MKIMKRVGCSTGACNESYIITSSPFSICMFNSSFFCLTSSDSGNCGNRVIRSQNSWLHSEVINHQTSSILEQVEPIVMEPNVRSYLS